MKLVGFVKEGLDCGKPRLIFVGARPAMGKTSFLFSYARELVKNDVNVLWFNLERGNYDWLVEKSGNKISVVDPEDGIDTTSIKEECKKIANKANTVVVLDYLQLIDRLDGSIIDVQRGLREIVDELKITVLVSSQISRTIEDREDKRPRVSDMAEQNQIESLYDEKWFLYRPVYYDESADRTKFSLLSGDKEYEFFWNDETLSVE